ncbi:hypothetical protein NW762_001609 [Fusarium torreyae]|uniref:RRM domain-containing protein n=1 Tax=Fusarium torreyae TaxID=1237075 RepID=A0A9W8SE65_9HYPO|nr:hypothetical protein NW762_001609 [Fusarium torreyae]
MSSLGEGQHDHAAHGTEWDCVSQSSLMSAFDNIEHRDANTSTPPPQEHTNPLRVMMEHDYIPPGSCSRDLSSEEHLQVRDLEGDIVHLEKKQKQARRDAEKLKHTISRAESRGQDTVAANALYEHIKKTISEDDSKLERLRSMADEISGNLKPSETNAASVVESKSLKSGVFETIGVRRTDTVPNGAPIVAPVVESNDTSSDAYEAIGINPTHLATNTAPVIEPNNSTSPTFENVGMYLHPFHTAPNASPAVVASDGKQSLKIINQIAKDVDLSSYDHVPEIIESRRVVIHNLPRDFSITQVADGVMGVKGLLSLALLETEGLEDVLGFNCAVVEFRDTSDARHYVRNVMANRLRFQHKEGSFWEAEVNLVESPSHPPTREHPRLYGVGYEDEEEICSGRCIEMKDFPMSAIWWMIEMFGVNFIVRVEFVQDYPATTGVLIIEFTCVFQAARLCRMVRDRKIEAYYGNLDNLSLGLTPSDYCVDRFTMESHNKVAYVNKDHLSDAWNKSPYNNFSPIRIPEAGVPIIRRPVPTRDTAPLPTIHENESLQNSTHSTEKTTERASIVDENKHYDLVGKHVFVRDRDTGYQVIEIKGIELVNLKTAKLQEPDWANFWLAFCRANNLPDIRRWDHYAKVAAVRRICNEAMGLPEWYAHDALKLAPIPDVILAYTTFSNHTVVSTT